MKNSVEDLVSGIRDTLHDPYADRYTDESIQRLLKLGLRELSDTKYFRKRNTMPLDIDINGYVPLPDDFIYGYKAFYNGCPIPFTYDKGGHCIDSCWECKVGKPEALYMYYGEIDKARIYPIPDDKYKVEKLETGDYGLLLIDNPTESDFNCKAIEQLDTDDKTKGIIDDNQNSNYGIGNIIELDKGLSIYYAYVPTIEEAINIDTNVVTALTYYVTAHLLLQDKESVSRSLGNSNLQLYERLKNKMARKRRENFSTSYYDITGYKRGR